MDDNRDKWIVFCVCSACCSVVIYGRSAFGTNTRNSIDGEVVVVMMCNVEMMCELQHTLRRDVFPSCVRWCSSSTTCRFSVIAIIKLSSFWLAFSCHFDVSAAELSNIGVRYTVSLYAHAMMQSNIVFSSVRLPHFFFVSFVFHHKSGYCN